VILGRDGAVVRDLVGEQLLVTVGGIGGVTR
jgi:hypothetical protein